MSPTDQFIVWTSNVYRIFTGDVVEGAVWLVTGELQIGLLENFTITNFSKILKSQTTWKMHTAA